MTNSFFGYGSLVNTATHSYGNPRPARVFGWRRQWVQSNARNVAFLSVTRDPLSKIDGLVADIGDLGWDALDEREAAYDRLALDQAGLEGVQMYRASPEHMAPLGSGQPILLSYLDCVVQGFLQHFGEDGVRDFFRSTSGWDTPVLNDREAPIYPRAQVLSQSETEMVNDHLVAIEAQVVAAQ